MVWYLALLWLLGTGMFMGGVMVTARSFTSVNKLFNIVLLLYVARTIIILFLFAVMMSSPLSLWVE